MEGRDGGIARNATREQARNFAQHDNQQWRRFYVRKKLASRQPCTLHKKYLQESEGHDGLTIKNKAFTKDEARRYVQLVPRSSLDRWQRSGETRDFSPGKRHACARGHSPGRFVCVSVAHEEGR
jgi:hypothetical protein